jgi:LPXTG-site transpeptidase (sortase) family protein
MTLFQRILNTILSSKLAFLATFFLVFLLSYILLVAIDFIPEKKSLTPATESSIINKVEPEIATSTAADDAKSLIVGNSEVPILPTTIYIKKLDRKINVLNPASRTIDDLDTALLSGVVRHPDSAHLAQNGNVFILGHSSYLPNVINKNFQAFNGIQNLAWGDIIEVTASDHIYVYEVEKVYKAKADNLTVPISGEGHRLTLATCNSFGSTDDRFIVEAKAIDVRPVSST